MKVLDSHPPSMSYRLCEVGQVTLCFSFLICIMELIASWGVQVKWRLVLWLVSMNCSYHMARLLCKFLTYISTLAPSSIRALSGTYWITESVGSNAWAQLQTS